MTPEDLIWNRAADGGGPAPAPGDKALADLLGAHGMICNGGVIHCLETHSDEELREACAGYRFFGFHEVADLLEEATSKVSYEEAREGRYEERLEFEFDGRYWDLIPNDATIFDRFESRIREHPEEFAPLHNDGQDRSPARRRRAQPLTSDRVKARVTRDFGASRADAVVAQLDALVLPFIGDEKEGRERVQAAILLAARGDMYRFGKLVEQAEQDWRDVLVTAGLADEDWPDRLSAEFGGEAKPDGGFFTSAQFLSALPLIGSLSSLLLIGIGIVIGGFMGSLLVGLGVAGMVSVITVAGIRAALKRPRPPASN